MMTHPACSDADFIDLFERIGPRPTARQLGVHIRNVYARRDNLERIIGRQITAPQENGGNPTRCNIEHDHRVDLDIPNGVVVVGSDAHYWPGIITVAHKALVRFCREMNPKAVIMNGDVFDGASVSRHSPIGWENRPSVIQEIEACQERLGEIEKAAPKAHKVWPLGNHDARFETRLATVAPEYAKVNGVHLRDHFPLWQPCWLAEINGDVVIKHRYKGGLHAAHNNTVNAGKTIITGHLHSPKVTPFTDYNGTRYGVDCGTLADPDGPQFLDYTEAGPKNWRSAFAVLTFTDRRLHYPELVSVWDETHVEFRGRVYEV